MYCTKYCRQKKKRERNVLHAPLALGTEKRERDPPSEPDTERRQSGVRCTVGRPIVETAARMGVAGRGTRIRKVLLFVGERGQIGQEEWLL